MSRPKYSKEECVTKILKIQKEIGFNNSITNKELMKNKIYKTIIYYWDTPTNMKIELNLPIAKGHDNNKSVYSDDELIAIIKTFIDKNGFFPSSEYWDKNSSTLKLPSLHTYQKHFGSWHSIKKIIGWNQSLYVQNEDGVYVNKYNDKKEIIAAFCNYYKEYNKVPTLKRFCEYLKFDISHHIRKQFGNYKNFVIECGYSPITKRKYTDEELDAAFLNFVKENGRVPTVREKILGITSVKPYINRFGSWYEACLHYGYAPNLRQPEYYLDNGEKCASSYECIVSKWLNEMNISYIRDVPYKMINSEYTGDMNCDYKIFINQNIWYVEIAGMLPSSNYVPTSSVNITYYQKLKKKKKLLEKAKCNYRIIYADEFKKNIVSELFDFIV